MIPRHLSVENDQAPTACPLCSAAWLDQAADGDEAPHLDDWIARA
jgi:hypothetical protein